MQVLKHRPSYAATPWDLTTHHPDEQQSPPCSVLPGAKRVQEAGSPGTCRVQLQGWEPEVFGFDVTGKLGSVKPVSADYAGAQAVRREVSKAGDLRSELTAVSLGMLDLLGLPSFSPPT